MGANWYYLWIKESSGNVFSKWYRAGQLNCANGTGSCAVTPEFTLNDGRGRWMVRSWNAEGYGPVSRIMPFMVNGSWVKPRLESPVNTVSNKNPTYRWQATPGASWYQLIVDDSSGTVIKKWYSAAQAGCTAGTGTCRVSNNTPLKDGNAQWRIQTWDATGYGPESKAQSFTINTVTGETDTDYLYDQSGRLISEFSNGHYKDYVYFNGQPLAMVDNGKTYYYHNNHLGAPEAMTDKNQAIVWKASYTPFGKATVSTETVTNNIRLPGQYFDAESGLHYNYFRYYDAGIGRYVTSDPIGLNGGINTYGYVGGNPVNFVDPFGLCASGSSPNFEGVCVPNDYNPGPHSASMAAGLSYNQNIDVRTQAQIDADAERLGIIASSITGVGGLARGLTIGSCKAVATKGSTILYQKIGKNGEHLKFGITKNPTTRYTKSQLNGGRLKELASGDKKDMLALERKLHEKLPIGSEEGQKFYINKQIEQGLKSPPYGK
jgi:RHS repeat-associated protein